MEKRSPQKFRTADDQPPQVNGHDRAIAREGGSTVALELLPERLNITKREKQPPLAVRFEEIIAENGALRAEIGFWRSLHDTWKVYNETIQMLMYENHHKLQDHMELLKRGQALESKQVIQLRIKIAKVLETAHDRVLERVRERTKRWCDFCQETWI